jgi:hypothetical protein
MSMVTRRRLKLTLVVLVLSAFVASAAASQGSLSTPSTPIEQEFWRWAIIQGGLLVALLIVLWSYRKDLVGVLASERERSSVLIELVKNSTAANEKSAAASEATEKAVQRLARALEMMEKRLEREL